jgi:hypothetical protein
MSSQNTLDATAATTASVTGFLRGVERRAALLAELQCGERAHGDAALDAAMQAFALACEATPPAGWPLLFWSTLLQAPALHTEPVAPFWDGDFAPLARLDFGTRAVLLLRVVAGLDDTLAAEVFGVAPPEFKQALQRALPQREDGSLDGEAWLAMNDEARYQLTHLPPDRAAAVARLRDASLAAALAASAPPPAPRGVAGLPLGKPRWLGKLWTGIGLG